MKYKVVSDETSSKNRKKTKLQRRDFSYCNVLKLKRFCYLPVCKAAIQWLSADQSHVVFLLVTYLLGGNLLLVNWNFTGHSPVSRLPIGWLSENKPSGDHFLAGYLTISWQAVYFVCLDYPSWCLACGFLGSYDLFWAVLTCSMLHTVYVCICACCF